MTKEEAREWLQDIKETEAFTDWAYAVAIDMAIEALKGRPKGEWKVRRPKPFFLCECSVCGESEEWMSKFCPNCGTDMRGRSEDDEMR